MTRIIYEPEEIKFWLDILARTPISNQRGGSIPGYAGLRFQRGSGLGSFFQGLFRAALPIISSIGANVGKQALRSSANLMTDFVDGKDIKTALRSRGKEAITALGQKGMDALNQTGSGIRQRRRGVTMTRRRSNIHVKSSHATLLRPYKRRSVRKRERTTTTTRSPLFEHAHF